MAEGLITVIIGVIYVIYKIHKEQPGFFNGVAESLIGFFVVFCIPLIASHGAVKNAKTFDDIYFAKIVVSISLIWVLFVGAVIMLWILGVIDIDDWLMNDKEKAIRAKGRFDQLICDKLLRLPVPSSEYLHAHNTSKGWHYITEDLARHWRVDQLDRIRDTIVAMPLPDEDSMKSYRESLGKQWPRKTDEEVIWQWRSEQISRVTKQIFTEHANNGIIELSNDQW